MQFGFDAIIRALNDFAEHDIEERDNNYWFEMKPDVFQQFNEMSTPEEQEKLLMDFFDEVLETVKPYL